LALRDVELVTPIRFEHARYLCLPDGDLDKFTTRAGRQEFARKRRPRWLFEQHFNIEAARAFRCAPVVYHMMARAAVRLRTAAH
jgi:hypothetical protein